MSGPDRFDEVAHGRRTFIRSLVLVAGSLAITSLHYLTDPSRIVLHEIYDYLCYVPIIGGAQWYGARGGVAVAAVTSAAFIPHIRASWIDNAAYSASLYAQVVAFHLLGLTLGRLASAQRRLTARYRNAAVSLESANRQLHDSQARCGGPTVCLPSAKLPLDWRMRFGIRSRASKGRRRLWRPAWRPARPRRSSS